jgi:hypothetical protein
MPFGSDDGWVWTASDGFEFRGSNAQALALRYARAQNEILRGNRSGVSLQLPAYVMPVAPLSFVYLEAGSVTGAYRANGMSWAINSDGILCAMDALFSGGVGGSGTPFFPVAPGITTLPAVPTPTAATPAPANALAAPEGFDPEAPGGIWSQLPVGTEPTYAQSIAPTALVPVVNERVSLVGATRSVLEVQERNYALVLPTVAVEYITKSVIQPFVRLAGDPLSVAISGQAAALKYTKRIKGAAGAFTTAGFGAGSIRDYRIGTNAGTFALSGNAALLKYQQLPLLAEATAFALAGQEARFFKGASFKVSSGSFSLSGSDAVLTTSRRLGADAGVFTTTGQDATLRFTPESDPLFSSVQLLLKGEGADNGTTFTDNSPNGLTPNLNNGAVTSTASFKYGTASLYFPATSSTTQRGLRYGVLSANTFATGDYTIELFFNRSVANRLGYLFAIDTTSAKLLLDASNNLRWLSTVYTPASALALDTWYHVAVTRQSSTVKLFLDGQQLGSDVTNTTNHTSLSWYVGRDNDIDFGFYGYIDELRVTKGVARYTTNFTPPTKSFPES